MDKEFNNVYEDARRAEAYARLEFPGTYYLAFRDMPEIIAKYVTGKKALDFGCGAGRSARFLEKLGFDVIGVDIAESMIRQARQIDPEGDYRVIDENGPDLLDNKAFDLILAAFTFDNIHPGDKKLSLFKALGDILTPDGKIIMLVSSPEIYTHEWASFTTRDFPENRDAKSGDKVKIIMTDVEDRRPVEDILYTDDAYRDTFQKAGLEVVKMYKPLAKESEPFDWINETKLAPWVIYVIKRHKS